MNRYKKYFNHNIYTNSFLVDSGIDLVSAVFKNWLTPKMFAGHLLSNLSHVWHLPTPYPEEGAKGLYYSIVLLASQTSSNTIPYPPSPQDWAKQQGGIARGLCVHCYNLYGRAEGARTVNRVGRIWIS